MTGYKDFCYSPSHTTAENIPAIRAEKIVKGWEKICQKTKKETEKGKVKYGAAYFRL